MCICRDLQRLQRLTKTCSDKYQQSERQRLDRRTLPGTVANRHRHGDSEVPIKGLKLLTTRGPPLFLFHTVGSFLDASNNSISGNLDVYSSISVAPRMTSLKLGQNKVCAKNSSAEMAIKYDSRLGLRVGLGLIVSVLLVMPLF